MVKNLTNVCLSMNSSVIPPSGYVQPKYEKRDKNSIIGVLMWQYQQPHCAQDKFLWEKKKQINTKAPIVLLPYTKWSHKC